MTNNTSNELEIERPLHGTRAFTVSVIGGPGCGKTTLIDATIDRLMPDVHVGVIACDLVSHRDADRISRHSAQVVQINTGEGGMLNASDVRKAFDSLTLDWIDLIFIENVGSMIGATRLDLGQDTTVAIFSVAAGDDKAAKHPDLVRAANIIVLNKIDLLGFVPFDLSAFRNDVARLNPTVEIIEVSSLKGTGMDSWVSCLRRKTETGHDVCVSDWFG